MSDKDKPVRTDGRTDKEIRIIAISGNFSNLTDKQADRFRTKIEPETYGRKKSQGGMIKGFSPIARPQRFKGTF